MASNWSNPSARGRSYDDLPPRGRGRSESRGSAGGGSPFRDRGRGRGGGGLQSDRSQSSQKKKNQFVNPITRLDTGETGSLSANFFRVATSELDVVYRYGLKMKKVLTAEEQKMQLDRKKVALEKGVAPVKPRDPPAAVKKRIIFLLIEEVEGKIAVATDFKTKMICLRKLQHSDVPSTHDATSTFRLDYYEEDEPGPTQQSPKYNISIRLQIISMRNLLQGLAMPRAQRETVTAHHERIVSNKNEVTSILNILISHRPNQYSINSTAHNRIAKVSCVGSDKFFAIDYDKTSENSKPPRWLKSEGLEALPGYFRSMRVAAEAKVLLNINTAKSAFYPSGPLTDVIGKTGFQENYPALQRYLKGLRVRTTHFRGQGERNEQTWSLNGLPYSHEKPTAAKVKFTIPANAPGHEELRSVLDHFAIEYQGLHLRSGDLVVSCGRHNKFIPAPYLEVLPGQLYKNKFDMAEEAVHAPDLNSTMITTAGRQMFGLSDFDDRLSPVPNFPLGVDANMVSVRARLLPQPPVEFRGIKAQITQKEADNGKWNLMERTLRKPVQGHKWAYLDIFLPKSQAEGKKSEPPENTLDKFCTKFAEAIRQYGITDCPYSQIGREISEYRKHQDTLGNEELLERQLLGTLDGLKKRGIKLFIVFLPYRATGLYQIVKKVGDTRIGIQTICRVCPNGPDTNSAVLANLVLKFNIKLGSKSLSANQALAARAPILTDNTMIFGIDVTHPGAGALKGAPSIAAVVGSVDEHFAQYPASFAINPRRDETDEKLSNEEVLKLEEMVVARLNRYKEMRGKLPSQIIVYRDGLSEQQFEMCKTRELQQIRSALAAVYNPMNLQSPASSSPRPFTSNSFALPRSLAARKLVQKLPTILLICVVKRNHCRFLPAPDMIANVRKTTAARQGKSLSVPAPAKGNLAPVSTSLGFGALPPSPYAPESPVGPLPNNTDRQSIDEYDRRFCSPLLDRAGNPRPGCLVDNTVTYGEGKDFFLISHKAIKGTARPAHYVIFENEQNFELGNIAEMTNNLCSLFQRSTTPVGVCPAVYYADLAADRARCYVRSTYSPHVPGVYDPSKFNLEVHEDLKHSMFYL